MKEPRLLLVDDCLDLVELSKFMLTSKGWIVDTAEDGLIAIDKLSEQNYDLILLDLQMPNMDGLGFLEWRQTQENFHTPIVIYTSHDDDQTKLRLKLAGADGVLHKPLKVEVLNQELQNYLVARS